MLGFNVGSAHLGVSGRCAEAAGKSFCCARLPTPPPAAAASCDAAAGCFLRCNLGAGGGIIMSGVEVKSMFSGVLKSCGELCALSRFTMGAMGESYNIRQQHQRQHDTYNTQIP